MYVIGIDPHKGSHTAAVLDRDEELRGQLRVEAGGRQRDQLLAFAAPFMPRSWAIEAVRKRSSREICARRGRATALRSVGGRPGLNGRASRGQPWPGAGGGAAG